MLLDAAAARWKIAASQLRTADGAVMHPDTGEKLPYAELAADAAKLSLPFSVSLKPAAEYRWIGQHVPRLDLHAKVTGTAEYGLDIKRPGMLTAVIARCPELGAELTTFDATAEGQGQGEIEEGLMVLIPQ